MRKGVAVEETPGLEVESPLKVDFHFLEKEDGSVWISLLVGEKVLGLCCCLKEDRALCGGMRGDLIVKGLVQKAREQGCEKDLRESTETVRSILEGILLSTER